MDKEKCVKDLLRKIEKKKKKKIGRPGCAWDKKKFDLKKTTWVAVKLIHLAQDRDK
jgi:hypothetical protein